MKYLALPSTVFLVLVCSSPAFAKHRHHSHPFLHHTSRHSHYQHHYAHRRHGVRYVSNGNHTSRPAAWCGWYMRQLMHVADAAFNLAANWAHYGHSTSPHVGAIVVWPHHVGKIVGGEPGKWAILSGNDGHRVRTRVRSIAGAIAFRE